MSNHIIEIENNLNKVINDSTEEREQLEGNILREFDDNVIKYQENMSTFKKNREESIQELLEKVNIEYENILKLKEKENDKRIVFEKDLRCQLSSRIDNLSKQLEEEHSKSENQRNQISESIQINSREIQNLIKEETQKRDHVLKTLIELIESLYSKIPRKQ